MTSNSTADRESCSSEQRFAKPSMCVINFNGENYLENCLSAIQAERVDIEEILLVDNGSDDRSLDLVTRLFPWVRVVALDQNLGPAVARNIGVREAVSDLVLLVDNDVILESGCVRALSEALSSVDRAAVVMPAVLYNEDREMIQYDGADSHFLGLMTLHHENTPYNAIDPGVREIGSVVSACVLVDRSRYDRGDLFDESYFIYNEDHEFGYRSRTLGLKILADSSARCFHGVGTAALSIRSLGHYSRRRVFYLIRNRWLFVLRDYSLWTLFVLSPVLLFYEGAQLAICVKKGWLGAWVEAIGSTLSRLPETLTRRRRIQRQRRQSDGELLTDGPIPFRVELTAGRVEIGAKRILDRVSAAYWRAVHDWL